MISANKVLILRGFQRSPLSSPTIQDPDPPGPQEQAMRNVAETAVAGTNVGSPVVAEDKDENDVLTYTLDDDMDKFTVDRGHGSDQRGQGREIQPHGR